MNPNAQLKLLAKNLGKTAPRSPRETLAGYVIAARTLDKCRAVLAGTEDEYHFDCPLDSFFFGFTEIKADDFKAFVATGATDDDVATWIEKTPTSASARKSSFGTTTSATSASPNSPPNSRFTWKTTFPKTCPNTGPSISSSMCMTLKKASSNSHAK